MKRTAATLAYAGALTRHRAREPSTWAGLAALLALAGVEVAPEQIEIVVQVLATIAGAAAVLLPDRPDPQPRPPKARTRKPKEKQP